MINLGQGDLLTLAGLLSIHAFQRFFFSETTWPIKAKFLYGASIGSGNQCIYK